MKLIFLGPPGAGKGTQAEIISQKLSIPHISTGDIFRQNIKNKTELGLRAEEIINKGDLVPDDITNAMVQDRLNKEDCTKGYILDGYPRTIPQAEFLDSIDKIDKVINFELDDKEVIKRISGRRTCTKCHAMYHIYFNKPKNDSICDKCGGQLVQRDDQKPAVVKNRLQVYKNQTQPLIDYYTKKGLLVNIDARPSIEIITNNVMEIINTFL